MYALLFHLCFNILTPLIYYIIMLVKVIGSSSFSYRQYIKWETLFLIICPLEFEIKRSAPISQ